MTKIRSLLAVSVALSLGAWAASCASFSSGDTGGAGGNGSGGSGTTSGLGGDSSGSGGDSSGAGGQINGNGGSTGSGGATNSGGSTGSGGVGSTGSGGMTTTGSGGSVTGSGGSMSGAGGMAATGGSTGSGGTAPTAMLPCDVLNAAGNTCVAAHSTVRVLLSSYTGPLYQVCKGTYTAGPKSCTSGMTKDILALNGYADGASQDSFCSGGTCTVSIIYDQSGMKNDLMPAPAGGAKNSPDNPVPATSLPVMAGGHKVYGVYIKAGLGYRAGCTTCGVTTAKGTATGDKPETEYMVTSKNGFNNGCCFDYGNAETDAHDDGNGTMEAVYFGSGVVWGTGVPGSHTAGVAWVEADLENGLYAGWENNSDQNISTNTGLSFDFISAVLVGDTQDKNSGKGRFALFGGDATQGALKTEYDGPRPYPPGRTGYIPMTKQGSIILGIGGDNSNGASGQFFEGVMASGAASSATITALQASIVAAQYGK